MRLLEPGCSTIGQGGGDGGGDPSASDWEGIAMEDLKKQRRRGKGDGREGLLDEKTNPRGLSPPLAPRPEYRVALGQEGPYIPPTVVYYTSIDVRGAPSLICQCSLPTPPGGLAVWRGPARRTALLSVLWYSSACLCAQFYPVS
jgi:hypothetical protein